MFQVSNQRIGSDNQRTVWVLIGLLASAVSASAAETLVGPVTIQEPLNTRLVFDSTGSNGDTPQIWRLTGNSANFVVNDITAETAPISIRTGAPSWSIKIDQNGRVGLGEYSPAANLHVVDDVFATIRLATRQFGGVPAQAWDIDGNAGGFSLTDIDGGRIPFFVETDAPNNLLFLSNKGHGHVGIGTNAPQSINGVATSGARHLNLLATSGEARAIVQGKTAAEWYIVHADGPTNQKIVRARLQNGKYFLSTVKDDLSGTNEPHAFCIAMNTGNVGIRTGSPTKPLQVGDAGANDGNGAHVTPGGVWTNASSRAVKEDIQPVRLNAARDALRALQPVTYRYKNEREEQYVGFIAEDVPELVATGDRSSLAPMDIAAVLTRVIQDQDRQLDDQQQTILRQERLNAEQQTRIAEQHTLLIELTKRLSDLERVVATPIERSDNR